MTHLLQASDEDRGMLRAWSRSAAIRAGLETRARIVLASANGHGTSEVSRRVGVSPPTVIQRRNRYTAEGLAGLEDAARMGRLAHVDEDAAVARCWRRYLVQPWRRETFQFSTDPELVAKVTDVIGLYLSPPKNAIVLCVDEKSREQALERTAPILPMRPGLP